MAKAKYDPNTFPLLAEQYAREGLIDTQIANNLGISEASYYNYQRDHLEFLEACTRGKRPANIEVENALKKSATGYEIEELHEEGTVSIKDGEEVFTVTKRKKVVKEVQPNVRAAETWLFNRDSKRWKDHSKLEVSGSADTIAGFVKAAKLAAEAEEETE
jgi:hypothetical protein